MKFRITAANGLETGTFQKCRWGQIDPMVDRGLSHNSDSHQANQSQFIALRKLVSCVTYRTPIIFAAGAGLRTFAANPFNTWIALSKARMLTKPWLANLLSISK